MFGKTPQPTHGEYDPTLPERPKDAAQYNQARPYSARRIYDLQPGNLFQTWPDYPEQVARYGKYYLRWILTTSTSTYYGRRGQKETYPQISIDGLTWLSFDETAQEHYGWSRQPQKPKPDWWNKEELISEIQVKLKEFKRARNRMLAKRRREKLKKEAEDAGVEFNEFKKQKTEKNKEERKVQQRRKAGVQMAETLNRKMTLAMALKDLRDEANELQAKIEDETIELDLSYIANKVDKIKTATRVLRRIGRIRKKK